VCVCVCWQESFVFAFVISACCLIFARSAGVEVFSATFLCSSGSFYVCVCAIIKTPSASMCVHGAKNYGRMYVCEALAF